MGCQKTSRNVVVQAHTSVDKGKPPASQKVNANSGVNKREPPASQKVKPTDNSQNDVTPVEVPDIEETIAVVKEKIEEDKMAAIDNQIYRIFQKGDDLGDRNQ